MKISKKQKVFKVDASYGKKSIHIDKFTSVSKIPDLPYTLKCKCGNTIVASDEPIPKWLIKKVKDTPCSACVKPEEFVKRELEKE